MHDAILYLGMFQGIAILELFAVAAFQACRPAPRHPRRLWVAESLPAARLAPDASNEDLAESYDQAA